MVLTLQSGENFWTVSNIWRLIRSWCVVISATRMCGWGVLILLQSSIVDEMHEAELAESFYTISTWYETSLPIFCVAETICFKLMRCMLTPPTQRRALRQLYLIAKAYEHTASTQPGCWNWFWITEAVQWYKKIDHICNEVYVISTYYDSCCI